MPQKKSFLLYLNYKNQFDLLSIEQRGRLITAIFEYCMTGSIQTKLSKSAYMAFTAIKSSLDRDIEKYDSICERNRENGKKGGRPKKPNSFF